MSRNEDDEPRCRRFHHKLSENLKKILEARKAENKSSDVREIADKAGINFCSIYNYLNERSNPSAYNLAKLAKALGVEVSVLLPNV